MRMKVQTTIVSTDKFVMDDNRGMLSQDLSMREAS
jgi:hypothetical protein